MHGVAASWRDSAMARHNFLLVLSEPGTHKKKRIFVSSIIALSVSHEDNIYHPLDRCRRPKSSPESATFQLTMARVEAVGHKQTKYVLSIEA